MKYSKSLLVLLLLACCPSSWAQSDPQFSSLEERMTGREFNQTGLHKLNRDELAALNRWIRERSLAENEAASQGSDNRSGLPDRPGELPEIERMAREKFQARIVGEFSGWTGDTEFELENGMVWRQDERDTFYIPPVENPTVTITPGLLGSWRLSVEGYNKAVRVERIE